MKATVKWNPCISQLTSLAMFTPGQEIQIIIWWHYQHLCYSSLHPPSPTNHDREWWCIFLCLFQCVGLFCFVLITKRLKSEAELIYMPEFCINHKVFDLAGGVFCKWREHTLKRNLTEYQLSLLCVPPLQAVHYLLVVPTGLAPAPIHLFCFFINSVVHLFSLCFS